MSSSESPDSKDVHPLDELLTEVFVEATEGIENLAAKSDGYNAEEFIQEARDLNPGAISRRALRVIDDIERFVRDNVDEILSPEDDPQDWSGVAYPLLPSGWLRAETMNELMDVERTLRDVRAASLNYGRFWQNNAGIGGFVKRAIGGYLNPLEGWLALVGKNSSQTEQDFLIGELADAFSDFGNAVETMQEHIITKFKLKLSEIATSAD